MHPEEENGSHWKRCCMWCNPFFWIGFLATFNIIELAIAFAVIGITAAVSIPVIVLARERSINSMHLTQLSELGIALIIEASDNPENQFAAISDGDHEAKSSTDVFNYLIVREALMDKSTVYMTSAGKVAPAAATGPDLSADNVCVNYMVNKNQGKIIGIKQDVKEGEYLPLLWSSGNEPVVVQSGASLKMLETNVRGKAGVAVYYVNNSARFRRATLDESGRPYIKSFIPQEFDPGKETFVELKP